MVLMTETLFSSGKQAMFRGNLPSFVFVAGTRPVSSGQAPAEEVAWVPHFSHGDDLVGEACLACGKMGPELAGVCEGLPLLGAIRIKE